MRALQKNPATLSSIRRNRTTRCYCGLVASVPGYRRMSVDGRAAIRTEHKMSFAQGIRLYLKAIVWLILLFCTIIMEGYDTALIAACYAFPVFRRSYGTKLPNTND